MSVELNAGMFRGSARNFAESAESDMRKLYLLPKSFLSFDRRAVKPKTRFQLRTLIALVTILAIGLATLRAVGLDLGDAGLGILAITCATLLTAGIIELFRQH